MVSACRFAAVLCIHARSAPVLQPKLERLTGPFLWQTGEGAIYRDPNLTLPSHSWYNAHGAVRLPGRKEFKGAQRLAARTLLYRSCVVATVYALAQPNTDGAWLLPSFLQKGVMIMTDYEILAIVLLVITLAFTVHNGTHK